MRYMHKPTLVDAHCVGQGRCPKWLVQAVKDGWIDITASGTLIVHTAGDTWVYAVPGDYIVKETDSDFYVISGYVFNDLYEPLKKGD